MMVYLYFITTLRIIYLFQSFDHYLEFNQKNIVNSQPITEDTFSKEISNVEDNKKTTSSDVEKVKPSLCRSDAFGLSVQENIYFNFNTATRNNIF